jgi:hypothetical protein
MKLTEILIFTNSHSVHLWINDLLNVIYMLYYAIQPHEWRFVYILLTYKTMKMHLVWVLREIYSSCRIIIEEKKTNEWELLRNMLLCVVWLMLREWIYKRVWLLVVMTEKQSSKEVKVLVKANKCNFVELLFGISFLK